jgi:hypothetical protein
MSEDAYEYKDMGLKLLMKLLVENSSKVKVGIPADNDARAFNEQLETKDGKGFKKLSKKKMAAARVDAEIAGDYASNATIGMKHEFGQGAPVRSFLRMPITEKLQTYLDKTNAFNKATLKLVIQQKTINPWLKILGRVAENVVGDAFHTGGFGKWPASNMANKKNHQTLVETTQLRDSITSVVES